MLIQFTAGNYRSFREKATLSLEATSDDWLEENNVILQGEHRLVKVAAIYGANAGGKSNFLAAMRRFRDLVMLSSKESQAGEKLPLDPFRLNTETESASTFFEAIFLQNGTRYRYGFEAGADAIYSEWLWAQKDSIRETRLFTREKETIEPSDAFKEGKGLGERTRPNALFLSVVAQFNGEIATSIVSWMDRFRGITGLDDKLYMRFTANAMANESEYQPWIEELVRAADFGIQRLKVEEMATDKDERAKREFQAMPPELRRGFRYTPDVGFSIKTYHSKFGADHQPAGTVEFDLRKEGSAGTQKFVAISGPFLHTLKDGAILCVDEMEARLHPKLTQALVSLFNSSSNTKGAQLIFASHDQGLLNSRRIRRDQVWFAEKNDFNESSLYCLDEFKVRKEAKFEKEYLLGEFGAVPRLGDFQDVLTHVSKK